MIDLKELDKFPYPFKEVVYRYSNNSILLDPPNSVEITDQYQKEIHLKRNLLQEFPNRCYQAIHHSLDGQWEIVELIIEHLVTYYPDKFAIDKHGANWTFYNKILNEEYQFIFRDSSSINDPLNFIGRHVQEDLILMRQRDHNLFLDAGHLCFPSNWSLAFNLGMSFKEIHSPIPMFNEKSLDDRILQFLMNIEAGSPFGRKNWSLMAGDRLDTSLETFDQWGKNRLNVTKENAGKLVHLRVEVQKLFRLPKSDALLFTIHTHLLPLEMLALKREWLKQFYDIFCELPEYIVDYKGIALYQDAVTTYLQHKLVESGN